MTRTQILHALDAFVESRPGFDPANYAGAPGAYRADYRRAYQHLRDARELLRAVTWRDSIDADALTRAKHHRIDFRPSQSGNTVEVDYCTGQYFPTEYRAAVCHTLVSALWDYWRAFPNVRDSGRTADQIRDMARRELGRSIARRWFGA